MKILSLILLFATVFCCLTGCWVQGKFKYMHDSSEIVRVEVVEATYDWGIDSHTGAAKQLMIATIENIDEFVFRLSKIPYRAVYTGSVFYMPKKCIAFKVSYSNGDYELFESGCRAEYISSSEDFSTFPCSHSFKSKKFKEFMFSYVSDVNGVYTFMHDITEITRIEYVNITNEDGVSIVNEEGQKTHEVINEIGDIDEFIRDQQSMRYIYEFDPEYEDAERPSTGKCFIITYANGDYEHFEQSLRIEASIRDDGNGYYKDYVNIGRFAPDDYAAFEAKYAGG